MNTILNYILWDADFAAFHFAGRDFRWYSFLFVSAIWVAYGTAYPIFKKEKIDVGHLQSLWLYCLVGAIVGARLGEVFFYEPAHYWANPMEVFKIWKGGLSSHGATFVLFVIVWLYAVKAMKIPFPAVGDRIVSGIALGASCVRFGNLMNSEIVGRVTDVPWAFVFKRVDDLPRHPIQLYEAFAYIFLGILLYVLYPKMKHKTGFISGLFLAGMFGVRFFLEFFKQNNSTITEGFPLTMGQVLSFPLALAGIYLMMRKTPEKNS